MLRGLKQVGRAKAIYSYNAIKDDELSLKPGNIINVYRMDLPDQGWWLGESGGSIGVFPENFVKLLSESGDRHHQESTHISPDVGRASSKPPPPPSKVTALNKPKFHAKSKDSHISNFPQHNESTEGFDFLKSSSKLSNVTAGRVKGPSRRPPTRQSNQPEVSKTQVPSGIFELDSCWGIGRESELQGMLDEPMGKVVSPAMKSSDSRKHQQPKQHRNNATKHAMENIRAEATGSVATMGKVSLEEFEVMQRELNALRGDLKEQLQTNERMVQTLRNFLQEERDKLKVLSTEFEKIKKSVMSKINFL